MPKNPIVYFVIVWAIAFIFSYVITKFSGDFWVQIGIYSLVIAILFFEARYGQSTAR